MCQATVFLGDEEILSDVAAVELVSDGVRLFPMFEASRVVRAKIREVDLLKHRILLEPLPEAEKQR